MDWGWDSLGRLLDLSRDSVRPVGNLTGCFPATGTLEGAANSISCALTAPTVTKPSRKH